MDRTLSLPPVSVPTTMPIFTRYDDSDVLLGALKALTAHPGATKYSSNAQKTMLYCIPLEVQFKFIPSCISLCAPGVWITDNSRSQVPESGSSYAPDVA